MKIHKLDNLNYDNLKYVMVVGNSGRAWFYPLLPNRGDHILVTDSKDWDKRGDGFGGSTLKLNLNYPTYEFELRGGWHSNSSALLADTGIDLTQYHATFGVICGKVIDYNGLEFDEILHLDDGWVIGRIDRVECEAQYIADRDNRKVCMWRQSFGGAYSRWVTPSPVKEF